MPGTILSFVPNKRGSIFRIVCIMKFCEIYYEINKNVLFITLSLTSQQDDFFIFLYFYVLKCFIYNFCM